MKTKKLRKISFFLIMGILPFMSVSVSAQFNSEAPWMEKVSKESRGKEITIDDMVKSFDTYWLKHDKNKKGSGYKPFMRWEYNWRNNAHPDGTLITPAEAWDAWKGKKKAKKSKTSLTAKIASWQPVGPFSYTINGSWSAGQGRVNMVYVDPNNASVLYVGTPAGGIWKSTNGGSNWSPMSDELPQIGVSGIVTDPTNSNTIYIATGDKDAGDTYCIGVLKSTNGGATWSNTGLTFSNTSTRASEIFIHPTNPNILWVATSAGLFKTTNAGVAWTNVLSGNIKDMKLKPGDPNTIYAVTPTAFYKSTNGGSTFAAVTTGLPASSGRLAIDVTPANSSYVYVLSATTGNAFQGLYRSTNSGTSFTKTSSTTNIFESTQAWYDMALAVSTTNADLVFTGCLNVWKSTNGGTSFTKVNSWSSPTSATYTHADIHFLRYYGNKLYCGSDGGIYVSSNDGASFSSLTTGLQIGQFYKVAVSKQTSANMVGGLQDNGGYAYSGNQWKNYYGADGMDTGVDPTNSSKYYGFIQNGSSLYITTNGGNSLTSTVTGPASGNWVTPLAVNSVGEVFGGYTKVYRLNGTSWVGSTTTFPSNIENLIVDPSNNNIMYATDAAKLYRSTDKGVNFTLIYTFPATVKDIRVHSSNGSILYAVTQGTSGLVYKSTDTGATFTSINNGLPSIGKNVIVHQANDPLNPLYVGTTLGVYYKDDSLAAWEPFDTNLPNVPVTDLDINYVDNNITAATYGRGIWRASISTTADGQSPSTPTNVVASGTTLNSTTLTWTASTDNVGVTGYSIFNGSTLVTTSATNSVSISGLTPSTSYSFSVRANDAAGNVSGLSNAVSVTTLASAITYCTSKGNSIADEFIDYVALGGIANTSGENAGYGNFTNLVGNVPYGSNTITFSAGFTGTAYSEYWSVWIDYNKNGTFESTELVASTSSSSAANLKATFTVPTTAIAGQTRMRVQMKYGAASTACETFTYGEVEDYTVNIGGTVRPSVLASTNENEALEIVMYPNPVEDILNISSGINENAFFKIFDLKGQQLKSGKLSSEINVSSLPSGIYILEVEEEQRIISKKFAKK